MEPTWTSGGGAPGVGVLVSVTLGACHTPTESCVVSHLSEFILRIQFQ